MQCVPMATPPIKQDELDEIIGLDNEVRRLQALRGPKADGIMDRLMSGAHIEIGHHTARVVVQRKGGVETRRLEVR